MGTPVQRFDLVGFGWIGRGRWHPHFLIRPVGISGNWLRKWLTDKDFGFYRRQRSQRRPEFRILNREPRDPTVQRFDLVGFGRRRPSTKRGNNIEPATPPPIAC